MFSRLCLVAAAVSVLGGVTSCSRPVLTPARSHPPRPHCLPLSPHSRPAIRPPEYVGVIEQVKVYPRSATAGPPVVQVLVRATRMGRPSDLVWVHLVNAVLEQNGAHLEAGAAVRVWAEGDEANSNPPQVWAEYIVCEPAGK